MIKTIHSKCSTKFQEFFAVEENFNVILKTYFQTSNFEIEFFLILAFGIKVFTI